MTRTALALISLCALLFATGCYTGTQAYVRPSADVGTQDPAAAMLAVEQSAIAHGLRLTRIRPERGEVVAVSTPGDLGGMRVRDHWRFWVLDGHVTVEMHPETQVDRDGRPHWQRMEAICDCYHYAREREMLREIRRRLRGPGGAASEVASSELTQPQL